MHGLPEHAERIQVHEDLRWVMLPFVLEPANDTGLMVQG
jgi:hypothetical protein